VKKRKRGSERDFVRGIRLFLFAVLSWFVASIASELIGSEASDTSLGQDIGRIALSVMVFAVPAILVVWLVLWYLGHRRPKLPEEDPEPAYPPLEPPPWRRPNPLYSRELELSRALQLVLARGVVVIAGPRDIGTSAVAKAVAQALIDRHGAEESKTICFDLRGRSTRGPDDARATAGRILSSFRLDEPADDDPAVLANAARRLIWLLEQHYDVLVLDNVSLPSEVAWLVREWPANSRLRLVLAGESAINSVAEDSTVELGELDLAGLRGIWDASLPESVRSKVIRWLRPRRTETDTTDEVDELLRACFGRPQAVKAFAREIRRPHSTVTVDSLLQTVRSAGPVGGQLERVWTAILDHIRDGLTPSAVWLLHALAELPVTALTGDAIVAMLGTRPGDPLEELRVRNLVLEVDGRYRMPTEIRRAIVGTTKDTERTEVALEAIPALLRHHIDQIDHWSDRLDAQYWFHDEERSLRPLFLTSNYPDPALLAAVIQYLPQISDALEAWYVREQQSSGLLKVNEGLHAMAERVNRPDLSALSAIRMATAHRMAGRFGEAREMLNIAAGQTARLQDAELNLREQIERALLGMTGPAPDTLKEAEASITQILTTRRTRPKATALATALINLGALCLQQNRPADATKHLRRAEKLAVEYGDIGCSAHAIELQGIAAPDLHEAVELWQRAKDRFIRIGEEQGQARCLQHLGSAALVEPTVAGQLRDGRPTALDPRAAATVALPLLEESKRLREGQPDTTLVDHYLALARARLT
jgi:tetratricopeptide (TPR) repeat protein